MLKNLKELLEKYTHIVPTERVVKDAMKRIVKEELNISLDDDDISYTQNTVHLHISPTAKSRIYMKKKILLKKLEGELGSKSPKGIH